MLARLYQPADAEGLDRMLGHNRAGDVRLGVDRIIVAGPPGAPTGVLVWRPGGFVHEFECGRGFAQRAIATALANYALAGARSQQFALHEAVFVVKPENIAMLRFAESIHAIEEEGRVFCLPLK